MILEFEGAGSYRLITDSTIERDIALSNLLRACGAYDAFRGALEQGGDVDSRLFEAVTVSGKLFDILGASLIPEGTDPLAWTPAIARETAEALRRITSPAAKQLLIASVVELVKAFFLAGLHSLATSRRSSTPANPVQPASANAGITSSATGA